MSNAYKCDRCGKLFSFREFSLDCILTKYNVARDNYYAYDLCPQCQTELERWFNNVQSKTNRQW